MSDLSKFKIHLDIQLRFRDTDAMGHINNAAYLSYLELARMQYWETLSGSRDYSLVDFILVRAEIDYRSAAKLGDFVRVYIRVNRLGRSSWDFEYKVLDQSSGRLIAEAKTVQCSFDYAKSKVKRLDPAMRRKIAEFEDIPAGGEPAVKAA